jgi:endonuclease/exonuclease/phosphatase family metal-dependent hydrolase
VHLKIVTYNIHRAIGIDRQFRLDRIVQILQHHAPDVALLQEVDDGAPRSGHLNLALELAEALEFPHLAVGHNVHLRQGRYGNATLSRFPIVRERNIDLTIGSAKPRGCQHATLSVESPPGVVRELEVFNLHLGLSARERLWQIGRFARSEEFRRIDESRPCLLGGDFNDWRNLLQAAIIGVLGFRCATSRESDGRGNLKTYPSFSPTGGLDRVYVRGTVGVHAARTCRLAVSKVASDHLPVVAELEMD